MQEGSKRGVLILSHGRPGRVLTLKSLRRAGYTGDVRIVCDTDDATLPEYKRLYPGLLETFSKRDYVSRTDQCDNLGLEPSQVVLFARLAARDIAERLGWDGWVELDDDYHAFLWRVGPDGEFAHAHWIANLDAVFDACWRFLVATPSVRCVALSQSGDWPGGRMSWGPALRKAMNSFFWLPDRWLPPIGRINEDVCAYVAHGRLGAVYLTVREVVLEQGRTSARQGGMTGLYSAAGTYWKSMSAVLQAPSAVRAEVLFLGPTRRIHHRIEWRKAVPCIVRP